MAEVNEARYIPHKFCPTCGAPLRRPTAQIVQRLDEPITGMRGGRQVRESVRKGGYEGEMVTRWEYTFDAECPEHGIMTKETGDTRTTPPADRLPGDYFLKPTGGV